jgi:ATP-dependent Clp protease ATP-binding subunit ClpA
MRWFQNRSRFNGSSDRKAKVQAYNWSHFTERARAAIWAASKEAEQQGHPIVSTEYLLFGLLQDEENLICRLINSSGLRTSTLIAALTPHLTGPGITTQQTPEGTSLSDDAKRSIEQAYAAARALENDYIGTEHLLLGLLQQTDCGAERILRANGVSLPMFHELLAKHHKLRQESLRSSSAPSMSVGELLKATSEHETASNELLRAEPNDGA